MFLNVLLVPPRIGQGQVHELHNEDLSSKVVDGQILKGVGCASGKVSGIARVITSLDEASVMQKGDILVTKYTDPSWCPLFSLASAVVLVDGGVLSHAAVVAREMGIPCVMQIKDAISLSGKTIVVDGTNGVVVVSQKE